MPFELRYTEDEHVDPNKCDQGWMAILTKKIRIRVGDEANTHFVALVILFALYRNVLAEIAERVRELAIRGEIYGFIVVVQLCAVRTNSL